MKIPRLFGKPRKPPLDEQVPTEGLAPSLWGAMSGLNLPADPPPGGDASYARMVHDPQVKACLNTKKFAVLARGWEVHPAGPSAEDAHVADFVRATLSAMDGSVLDACHDLLDALARGVSILEINWRLWEGGPWAGRVGLASLKAKDPSLFALETDPFLNLTALRGMDGVSYPPDKFLIFSHMPRYGGPWGVSDLRAAYNPWFMKDRLLTWWAKYLEKFGLPTVTGTYDAARGYTRQQQGELLSIVAQVHNESAVVLPSDMTLGLLETGRMNSAGFDECVSYLDRAIAKSILGQTLTSDSTSHTSTYALGAIHFDVLRFYIDKLARDLEESVLTRQLIARLVSYNFPPGTPCPTFRLGRLDDGKLAAVGHMIAELVNGNVLAPDEPWIRDYLGLPAQTTGA